MPCSQSCFSLLFGDGNPNANLAQRTSAAAAALIRANGGAVTAEQLAPLLAPEMSPEQFAEEAQRPGAPVRDCTSDCMLIASLITSSGGGAAAGRSGA